jgi:hypothetical protein
MPATPKRVLHRLFLAGLNSSVEAGPLTEIPFRITLPGPGQFIVYLFTLTSPPGGRPTGEYKIQLIVPGQGRGNRGTLQFRPGSTTLLGGWSPSEQVFVLWDAYAHKEFAYSQNLQVQGKAVWTAASVGLATCERVLRDGNGMESVVVCKPAQLREAVSLRLTRSAERLMQSKLLE